MRNDANRCYEAVLYKKVIGWFVGQLIYTFLGALLFVFLEECQGKDEITNHDYKALISYIENEKYLIEEQRTKFKNITKKYFESSSKKLNCELDHDNIAKWWSFTTVTCYTIGKSLLIST